MSQNSITQFFHRMGFIMKTLQKESDLSLTEISTRWLDDVHTDGNEILPRTFQRTRDTIFEIFGVVIDARKVNNRWGYFIRNPEDIECTKISGWIIASFQNIDLLLHERSLHHRIIMEEFPSENGRLQPIFDAMHASAFLQIDYRRYGQEEVRTHTIAPYWIKQYKQRLYVVGPNPSGKILSFSLDRIMNLRQLSDTFYMPRTMDAELYFLNAFGIVADDDKYPPQRVVLRASANEACYLRDVPIHQSQEVIAATDDYTEFAYTISITDELIGHILSRADRLRVISPTSLAEEVKHRHLMSAALYD